MPTNLSDDPIDYPKSILVPSATDTASSSGVRTPMQQLANRTAWLKRLLTTSGVNRLRSVPAAPPGSTAAEIYALLFGALRDVVGATDQVCLLPGLGIYVYDAAASDAENLPWIVEPSGSPPTGRWFHELYGLTLDGTLPTYNTVRDVKQLKLPGSGTHTKLTSGSGWTDVVGLGVTLPSCEIGDLLMIDGGILLSSTDPNTQSRVTVAGTPLVETEASLSNSPTSEWATVATVAAAGDVDVRIQVNRFAADVSVLLPLTMRVTRIKP